MFRTSDHKYINGFSPHSITFFISRISYLHIHAHFSLTIIDSIDDAMINIRIAWTKSLFHTNNNNEYCREETDGKTYTNIWHARKSDIHWLGKCSVWYERQYLYRWFICWLKEPLKWKKEKIRLETRHWNEILLTLTWMTKSFETLTTLKRFFSRM